MKRRLLHFIGAAAYWGGWPFYMIYFRLMKRTRILLVRGDEVLLVKSWLSNGRWGMPGGGLGKREDPEVGVLRELFEELSIRVPMRDLRLLGTETYRQYGYRYIYYQFIAEVLEEVEIRPEWYEIADARWVNYRELTDRNAGPDVLHAVRRWRDLIQ